MDPTRARSSKFVMEQSVVKTADNQQFTGLRTNGYELRTRPTSHTALLVFSLSAQREAGRKGVLAQPLANVTFFESLIRNTEAVAQASGLSLIWSDESQQRGQGFGERLSHAFADLFAAGYEQVIAIGNDTPDLSADILAQAVDQLQAGRLVVGPSLDGGAYLIGAHRSDFDAASFEALPWTTTRLRTALVDEAQVQEIAIVQLAPLADIDDAASLERYVRRHPRHALAQLVQQLLQVVLPTRWDVSPRLPYLLGQAAHALRGPPC